MPMDYDIFVMYDANTLGIISIGPCEFTGLMEGHRSYKIKNTIPFLKYKISGNNQIINISKEHSTVIQNLWRMSSARELAYTEIVFSNKRHLNSNNKIGDLDFKTLFFDYFGIEFTQNSDSVTLELDLEKIDPDVIEQFLMSVNEQNGLSTLYVTRYRDPTALISTHKINLNEFKTSTTITVPITTNEKVSLWATRDF